MLIMRYCVMGQGTIGSALTKRLGDVSFYPTPETEVLFYMSSVLPEDFDKNPEYHLNKVVQDFLFLLPYCKRHRIRFVFASSSWVYEKDNDYARCKRILELMAQSNPNTLALRMFPVYPARSVIAQWCDEMKRGIQPTVYGDGTQIRDFIHIDDVVEQIILLEQMNVLGIADIGTGKPISFNEIIEMINKALGTTIKPKYIEAPKDYSPGIFCVNPLPTKVPMYDSIQRLLER